MRVNALLVLLLFISIHEAKKQPGGKKKREKKRDDHQQEKSITAVGSGDADMIFRQALLAQRNGRLDSAAGMFRKVIADYADEIDVAAKAWFHLSLLEGSRAADGRGRQEAARCARQAWTLDPSQPEHGMQLGDVLFVDEAFDDAAATYRAVARKHPTYGLALMGLARAESKRSNGDPVVPLQSFLALPRTDRGPPPTRSPLEQARTLLGSAYRKRGDNAEAMKLFRGILDEEVPEFLK